MRKLTLGILLLSSFGAFAAKNYDVVSPDGRLKADINVDKNITYSVTLGDKVILEPSAISMTMENGTVWGNDPKVTKCTRKSVDATVASPFYRADKMAEKYNAATLDFKGGYSIEFRAYNDGIAYRFIGKQKKPLVVRDEEVVYNFPFDATAYVPYAKGRKDDPYFNSFENEYAKVKLSEVDKNKIAFLPLVVDLGDNVKVCITESDLEQFPGLYLVAGEGNALKGSHARYPKTQKQGGHNELQMVISEREDFIAKTSGNRTFPWRVAVVTDKDKDLAATNLSYLLASPSRVADTSWIKPGKVAWDWWNDWNLTGVDFKTGVNNDTYKKFIDFAAEHNIEYVILDEGWAVNKKADLMQIVPEIDLKELIDYAAKKNVGIVLWAGYYAFDRDLENVCKHYADMGVKGFKVDFMDRDDQQMTAFNARAAEMCAKYRLVLDLHGTHKPAGINRTYPNVLNVEGVNGLEQVKWSKPPHDQVTYDVMIPYIRQAAGPMDYTQGAMRNASKGNYYPCNSEPMSQGTRCRQLALYMVFDSPLNMMCDTPSNYRREGECTDFIASVPTVWDETIVVDGRLGEYIVTARRSGDTWYIGGITDWSSREIDVDCSFLPRGVVYEADVFVDGVNADRIGRDYRHEKAEVTGGGKMKVRMAPGGGFAVRLKAK